MHKCTYTTYAIIYFVIVIQSARLLSKTCMSSYFICTWKNCLKTNSNAFSLNDSVIDDRWPRWNDDNVSFFRFKIECLTYFFLSFIFLCFQTLSIITKTFITIDKMSLLVPPTHTSEMHYTEPRYCLPHSHFLFISKIFCFTFVSLFAFCFLRISHFFYKYKHMGLVLTLMCNLYRLCLWATIHTHSVQL